MALTDRIEGIELLAPARDVECGRAAIACGADAVYAGGPQFGAREAAGNSLDDIAALARYAHKFWARLYVTLNTLLYDDEIPQAQRLAWELSEAGVDGLIIQDAGLLECELPPLPLIASTQMHNHTPERVAFLEQAGFRRAILARELEIGEVRAIHRAAPRIELEFFVHGALCVCYSGQCYLSYALGGRSGNRGQCAQPCRKAYTVLEQPGHQSATRELARDCHALSLRDLNLSAHLEELIDAGITSFKIEGRLKDRAYVSNVVAGYSHRLNGILKAKGLRRSSSGAASCGFTPNLDKTFHRRFTTHFLHGRQRPMASFDTPKMIGEPLGEVGGIAGRRVTLAAPPPLRAGDGVCFFEEEGRLRGTAVNGVTGNIVLLNDCVGIRPGTLLYRNSDSAFLSAVNKARPERRIAVRFILRARPGAADAGGLVLIAADEDGNQIEASAAGPFLPAQNPGQARLTLQRQIARSGESDFRCATLELQLEPLPFVPVAALNALRREALERLAALRAANRPRLAGGIVPNDVRFPQAELSYLGNVLNRKAETFYRRHGVTAIEPGAESGLDLRGRKVMTCRYCIRYELSLCPRYDGTAGGAGPLSLVDEEGRTLIARFNCARCEMEIHLPPAR